MLTPAEAERLISQNIRPFEQEDCPIAQAHGRVLRAEVRADRDLPPFDRVTMDGYAVRSKAISAGVRTFRIEAVQAAGMRPGTLGPAPDSCIEIMTGAVLPSGADCVVPSEEVTRAGGIMQLSNGAASLGAGHAVHRRGSDHRAGEVIIPPGTRLTGREIAVAAACGYSLVPANRQPQIAVIATGDELVEVDATVASHQIRRSNDYALRAALAAANFPRVDRYHFHDMRPEIEHLLWHIIAEYDVVLLCGGVSKGKFDYLPSELDRQGVLKILHGVAQRPGKPFWFGVSERLTPIFALPGNPVSAYTCLHRYVIPALNQASGLARAPLRSAILASPAKGEPKLASFLPVKVSTGPGGELFAAPAPANTSGDFGGLVGTDGFVELPAGERPFPAGTLAVFWPWV